MADASSPLYDSTRPQFFIAGREHEELARDAQSLEIEEDGCGLKRLRLSLGAIGPQRGVPDETLLYLDGRILDYGTEIQVSMGPHAQSRTVFKGRLSSLALSATQGSVPEVRICAEDALMDFRMTRRFKTYENLRDAEIAEQLASEHGLRAAADAEGPTHALVQQWNQTDLAFLRERAQRIGAQLWIDDGTLHFSSRTQRAASAPRLTLVQGNELLALEISADLAHQRSSVHASGYDEIAKAQIDESAQASDIAGEAAGHRHGIEVLERAFGTRDSYRVNDVPFAGEQAQSWARAALQARARSFVQVRGITTGSPTMTVGATLELQRVGALFEGGDYIVTQLRHQYDTSSGFRTQFCAERCYLGNAT
ncbi:Phage late control gene D protein (GPD) [Solimonas aquatica]|uniref:Phage late control gene D protein (GPD) n=1 Tax=Solimonas aquatica TaxID=489703 RepID=A0A1H8ZHV2_9GAMM|nr:contractile injection system protein, VgrG/Pvc8 family [Solimonas aquatica]SEP63990.1 Phage late control gene D protein (GPD) [Solimonas aquatica]